MFNYNRKVLFPLVSGSRDFGILYISYDGMLEPLGQSQVLSYLKLLSINHRIYLISFEKQEDWADTIARVRLAHIIADAGISWHPLRYHKHPSALATIWDIACGFALGLFLILRHKLRIVHARSYVAAVMGLALKRLAFVKFIFDMRGFWADERVDGGIWPANGLLFRMAKRFERRFLQRADHVVSLTHAAVQIMLQNDFYKGKMPPITVISTCADLKRFIPQPHVFKQGGFVLGYVGTVGTWYLFDEVVACFRLLLRLLPDAKFLILNRGEHAFIMDRLAKGDVPLAHVELKTTTHAEVPNQIARMDAGIFFIKPTLSKQASAPTKLAEFLGCGIPCLGNSGVGDVEKILVKEEVGVSLTSFDQGSINSGLCELLKLTADPATPARCVAVAQRYFSLDEGVKSYSRIYSELLHNENE